MTKRGETSYYITNTSKNEENNFIAEEESTKEDYKNINNQLKSFLHEIEILKITINEK